MHVRAVFPPEPGSVTAARCWLAEQLEAHDRDDPRGDAELCLSELAANAVRYALTPFEVELSDADGPLRIAVSDESSLPPRPREPPATAITGRGLLIIAATATAWGVLQHHDGG